MKFKHCTLKRNSNFSFVPDFHHSNQNQEFQSLRADVGHNFKKFSPQEESQDEDEDNSEEEESGKDDENGKENLQYVPSAEQNDSPRHTNYQSHSLQDISSRFRNPAFEFNQVSAKPYQNFILNQHDSSSFRLNPAQFNFRPSPRDFSDHRFQDLGDRTGFEAGKINPTGKTAPYQGMNYNTPERFSDPITYDPRQHENIPMGPITSLEPHTINMDMVEHLPYSEDTYYPPQNGNYKYSSQPEVETPVGKVLNSLNVPPAHSFPSTSHLLIPPQEKLPNYSENNQNLHLNLPPPGTPISHNHHHTGQFERYD